MRIRKEAIRLTKATKWEEEEVYSWNIIKQSIRCTFPSIVVYKKRIQETQNCFAFAFSCSFLFCFAQVRQNLWEQYEWNIDTSSEEAEPRK